MRVYELLAKAGPLSSQLEQALRSYKDEVSRTMADRSELHRKMPPPEAWDGVFEQVYKK